MPGMPCHLRGVGLSEVPDVRSWRALDSLQPVRSSGEAPHPGSPLKTNHTKSCRRKRSVRSGGAVVRLTERDEALLLAVARFGMARSSDLKCLLFPDRHKDVLAHRLRKLFDAGYLEVLMTYLNQENTYTLGPAGKLWTRNRGITPVRPPKANTEHWLGIVSTWVKLSRFAHETPGWTLRLAKPEWELRPRIGGPASAVIPDLVAELSIAGMDSQPRILHLAIEIDRATEASTVLNRKLAAYGRLLSSSEGLFGRREFGLGFALSGWNQGRRRQAFLDRLKRIPTWSLTWDLDEGPGVALFDFARRHIDTVTEARSGNGTGSDVSDGAATEITVDEEGLHESECRAGSASS